MEAGIIEINEGDTRREELKSLMLTTNGSVKAVIHFMGREQVRQKCVLWSSYRGKRQILLLHVLGRVLCESSGPGWKDNEYKESEWMSERVRER